MKNGLIMFDKVEVSAEQLVSLRPHGIDLVYILADKCYAFLADDKFGTKAAAAGLSSIAENYIQRFEAETQAVSKYNDSQLSDPSQTRNIALELSVRRSEERMLIGFPSLVYEDIGFGGAVLPVPVPVPWFKVVGWNDRISSVKSGGIIFCNRAFYRGDRLVVAPTVNDANLHVSGWGDCISSAL